MFAGKEVDWVQCDGGCEKWFHLHCVGLAKSALKDDEDYYCDQCRSADRPRAAPRPKPKSKPAKPCTSAESLICDEKMDKRMDDDDDQDSDPHHRRMDTEDDKDSSKSDDDLAEQGKKFSISNWRPEFGWRTGE